MANKQASNAEAEEYFDPEDFVLHGPHDRVVSKILGSKKIFNVFSGKTLSNLSIKDKLIDGVWQIEDKKTQQVRDFMLEKMEKEKLERESKLSLQANQAPEAQPPVV